MFLIEKTSVPCALNCDNVTTSYYPIDFRSEKSVQWSLTGD